MTFFAPCVVTVVIDAAAVVVVVVVVVVVWGPWWGITKIVHCHMNYI